jgi:hypothetical protein
MLVVLQVAFSPYDEGVLEQADSLERLSLLATVATIYLGMYFGLDSVGTTARILLGLVLLLGNAAVILYFIW